MTRKCEILNSKCIAALVGNFDDWYDDFSLINLENLDRKRKLDQDDVTPKKSKRHKSKSTKLKNSSDISNSDSSDDNTDIDSLSPTLLGEDDIPSIPSSEPKVVRTDADFMKLLLDCISDGSDLLEDSNDDSSSSTDIDKNHNKKKSEDTVVEKPVKLFRFIFIKWENVFCFIIRK